MSAARDSLTAPREPLSESLAVAFSGGADSTALLMAAAQTWPGRVTAIHVDHGLQAEAADFVRHCRVVCDGLGIPLHVRGVDARHGAGESPEDAARKARYLALAQAAISLGLGRVLLAQHADDQVETVLLALSRGAGLPGLAGMAPRFDRHGMRFERPLLGIGANEIRQWLQEAGIAYVDDPSNANTALTRNRIRQHLLPALEQAFPRYRETFARSARHAAQAQALLAALAQGDLQAMDGRPILAGLQALSEARQANLLRHWLSTVHGQQASAAQMDELVAQIAACTTRGHRIRNRVADGLIERMGEQLVFARSL